MCMNYYRDAKIKAYGHVIPEKRSSPAKLRALLTGLELDILISTGHDGLKKKTHQR